ncbi:YitT family protein [uncultured Jatrophihabitans sp.]|uniref:membrane protein YczE n=1 Tax=uncultured Jatrophihabitans sp. TaxID=1610747 RepID=UPI0035C95F28
MRYVAAVPADRRAQRTARLLSGLLLYGVSDALLIQAGLGVDPWDVLHQGLARTLGLQVGTWSIIVGAVVLMLWVPLRQRPGIGTLANVVLVGLAIDVTVWCVPAPHRLVVQIAVMLAGVVLNGLATGLYIGAGMGPGPRDGLMTGLAARGHSVRVARTAIEVTVLVAGWLLGGSVGVGTVVYALGIGPLAHLTLPMFALRDVGSSPRARCA